MELSYNFRFLNTYSESKMIIQPFSRNSQSLRHPLWPSMAFMLDCITVHQDLVPSLWKS